MFYENLNTVLGRLFYYAATLDGKVHVKEKEILHELVQQNWKALEKDKDEYGTAVAYQIDFAFDFEESRVVTENGLEVFADFYQQHQESFTPAIKENIINTIKGIANSFHGVSKLEHNLLGKVKAVLNT